MTLHMEKESEEELDFDYKALIQRVVEKTAEQELCPYEIEVNVLLTDNEGIRKLNLEYRELNCSTDVLSFPLVDYELPAQFSSLKEYFTQYFNPETKELVLGDIVISLEKAREQATAYGHSLVREIAFLTAHSMLHLFGYDHMEEQERILMEEKQNQVLTALSILREGIGEQSAELYGYRKK